MTVKKLFHTKETKKVGRSEKKKYQKFSAQKYQIYSIIYSVYCRNCHKIFFYSSSSQALRMFMSLIHNTFTSNHKRMRKGEKKMWHFYEIIHRKIVARIFFRLPFVAADAFEEQYLLFHHLSISWYFFYLNVRCDCRLEYE